MDAKDPEDRQLVMDAKGTMVGSRTMASIPGDRGVTSRATSSPRAPANAAIE
jgi:hypothetical protein